MRAIGDAVSGKRNRAAGRAGRVGIRLVGIPWLEIGILYAVLVALIATDVIVAALGGFSVDLSVPLQDGVYAVLFAGIGAIYAVTGRSSSLACLLFVVAALVFGAPAIMILDFMTKASGFPLADQALAAWDDRLRLDWLGYEHWFSGYPWLSAAAGVLYACAPLVLLAALVALSWTQRLRDMVGLAIATSVTLIVCVVIGGFLPAAGPYQFYGVPDGGKAFWVQTLVQVVAERPRLVDLNGQPPLTTFPSFHTTLAVLAILFCWRIRRFGPIFALFNLFWALSIPVWGSHYFIDVIVGAVIAIVGYGLARALSRLRDASGDVPAEDSVPERAPSMVGVAQEAGE